MIRFWGRLSSINGRKVEWVLREVGAAYRRIDTGREFGGIDTAEFFVLNPNRLIPVIDDDGFVLWESNAIVRYLAARYATGTLYPEPLSPRFDAERWMDWQQTTLNPAGRGAFMQLIRTPAGERNQARIDESRAAMQPLLALLDAHLERQPFMAGNGFTMADIPVACEIHRWFGLALTPRAHPHLERWYGAVSARAAAQPILALPLS
ncbi:MAG: glutathione S-transferase family protein [Betaproteobacteria bacterium]